MSERHAILGAGGIGGLIGTLLAAGGDDVTMVVREATVAEFPPELTLRRSDGSSLSGPVHTVSNLASDERVDVLWVTTKALQLEEALGSVRATHPRCVVPLLNGLDHMAVLERVFGASVVIPGTIAVEAERLEPGIIRQGSPFATLRLAERGRPLLAHAADVLERSGAKVEFEADEKTLLWSKLVFLAPFALATSASGENLGFLRDHAEWRDLAMAALHEVVAVGRAEGAKLDPAYAEGVINGAPASMRSSMARDIASGKEPELDAIAGAVIRAAERHNVAVPALRDLSQRVRDHVARSATAAR